MTNCMLACSSHVFTIFVKVCKITFHVLKLLLTCLPHKKQRKFYEKLIDSGFVKTCNELVNRREKLKTYHPILLFLDMSKNLCTFQFQ